MDIKFAIFALALALPLAAGISARQTAPDAALLAKAKAIHAKAITIPTWTSAAPTTPRRRSIPAGPRT